MKDLRKLLGIRIKELRQELNMTQEQLAEIANIDIRTISNAECGATFPSKCLIDIADALKVKLPELFDFEHLKYDDTQKIEYIIEKLPGLTPQEIETVFRVVKAMR